MEEKKRQSERHAAIRAGDKLARSVITLLITPLHEKLHVEAELAAEATEQPLMPAVEEALPNVRERLAGYRDTPRVLGAVAMLNLSAALMQFTDHSGVGPDDIVVAPSFAQTEALRMEYEQRQGVSGPLDATEQLDAALSLTGRVDDSLMLLWASSRQYARWLDSTLLPNEITDRQQRLDTMLAWRRTIKAHKTRENGPQDPAGDNYYMWTHALAQYAWRVSSGCPRFVNNVVAQTFWNGTDLMHGIVHRINRQSVPNNHTAAARYGNVLGDTIAKQATNSPLENC